MISEPFANGNSLVHRLDPRVKILCVTVYSFAVALSNRFPALAGYLVFSLVLIGLAQLNLREVFSRILIVNAFILLLWVVLPLTFEGEPLFSIGPFTATREGILTCAGITLKSNSILLAFISLAATSSLSALGSAMNRLHLPDKIVLLLLMTYRYVFVIELEYQRLVRAAKIRGFSPKTDMHTYRTYAYLIGMIFVRSSDRSERVHKAMLCRGFKGKFYCIREFSFTRLDLIWSVFMTVAIVGLGLLELLNI
ncbi:MAG: cobalt ECF transporter T component CbiQ [Desulfobacteraceae bacterium]|nr:cobalt ECF transporter T component CbiQ [Desulfobacteraceae bacterium]